MGRVVPLRDRVCSCVQGERALTSVRPSTHNSKHRNDPNGWPND